MTGGVGSLTDALAAGLDPTKLFTKTQLTAVGHSSGQITAQLIRNGSPQAIQARQVVLCVPPRVIADTMSFEPKLDTDQMQALRAVPTWMAGQAKIIAVYDEPPWPNAGPSGDAIIPPGPTVEIHAASPVQRAPYALLGFVGVPAEARIGHKGELLRLAKAQLTAMFGAEMAKPKDLVMQDWATVPEIARSQDMHPVGSHPSYGLPTNLRGLSVRGLHFSSTETAQEFGGFLEGALEAAEHLADKIAVSEAMTI